MVIKLGLGKDINQGEAEQQEEQHWRSLCGRFVGKTASDPATASDKIWFIPRTKYTNKLNNKTYAVQESLGLYIETAPQSKTEL